MIWAAAGSALAGMSLMYAEVWFGAVPFLLLAIVLLTLDNRRFNRADAIYQRESDERLERLRAHCETPPRGEEED